MNGLLLDTHIVLHWMMGSRVLSRHQTRAIETASMRGEPLGISDISLLEIALLHDLGRIRVEGPLAELFDALAQEPYRIFPITSEIAAEAGRFRILKDPMDRTIAATARVHGLKLVTSDQRILESNLVSTIE